MITNSTGKGNLPRSIPLGISSLLTVGIGSIERINFFMLVSTFFSAMKSSSFSSERLSIQSTTSERPEGTGI
jgi:hypothetical protein